MGDEIKPVVPVLGVQPELPARAPELLRLKRREPAVYEAAPAEKGYDLSAISADQAQRLLETPLMQDETALAHEGIATLKSAIARRAARQAGEPGDRVSLLTAGAQVEMLVVPSYRPGRPGEPFTPATSGALLAKIDDFNRQASSFGQEMPVMRF